jgi:hypothetical protein
MIETFIPRSTHIGQVTYDSDTRDLNITFADGSEYRYISVPVTVFQGMQNASSAGQYFHRQIKDRYGYEAL